MDRPRQVEMTPPGDARPAFAHDVDFLQVADSTRQFGPGCGQRGHPGRQDRPDEQGPRPGPDGRGHPGRRGRRHLALRPRCRLEVHPEGARRPADCKEGRGKGMVMADDGAVTPILNSSNLMVPGVLSAHSTASRRATRSSWSTGPGGHLATGVARMAIEEMMLNGKGDGGQDPLGRGGRRTSIRDRDARTGTWS